MSWAKLWGINAGEDLKVQDVTGINIDLIPDLVTCHKCGKRMQDDPGGEDRWWHLHITPIEDKSTCPDCRTDE